MSSRTPSQIQAELDLTRLSVTETVDELAARLHPKALAASSWESTKSGASNFFNRIKQGDVKSIAIAAGVCALVALAVVAKVRTRK